MRDRSIDLRRAWRGVLVVIALCGSAACSDAALGDASELGADAARSGTSGSQSPPVTAGRSDAGVAGGAGTDASAQAGSSGASGMLADGSSPAPDTASAIPPEDAGSAIPAHDAGLADGSAPELPPTDIDLDSLTGVDAVLCDGRPGITFAAFMKGGGLIEPGAKMMDENGIGFFVVEGTCRFYSQYSRLYRTVTGRVMQADLARLRADFRLEDFQALVGDYGSSVFDGPGFYFVFGRGGLTRPCVEFGEYGGCIGSGLGAPRGDINALRSALLATLDRLSVTATPVRADVRYLLLRDDRNISEQRRWSNPASWPLGDPETVALDQTEANAYEEGMSKLATGADAAALRELWRRFLDYEVSGRFEGQSPSVSSWIPIRAGSAHYHLFIRDSIPLEDARGLIDY